MDSDTSSNISLGDSNIYEPAPLAQTDVEAIAHNRSRRNSRLSRINSALSQRYQVDEVYPNLTEDEILLRRTETKNTIISTLANRTRCWDDENGSTGAVADEENQRTRSRHSVASGVDSLEIQERYNEETQENALPTLKDGLEFEEVDPELVTWDSADDPLNPRNWSVTKKWSMTMIVSGYTLLAPFASSMMSPSLADIAISFGITSETIRLLMISIFLLGLLIGPLITAPISEMYGRRRVLNVSVLISVLFNLGCALCHNTALMCVCRFFAGLFGSAPLSIGAGCLGDMFTDKMRNKAIAFYSLGPTVGPNVSPIIAGFILTNDSLSWRWPLYVLVMFGGAVSITGCLFLQETYAPQILYQKLKRLRKETGNENLHSIYEIVTGETVVGKFYINLTRPLKLLLTNPMVFGLGSFMALIYGCLYVLIVTFPSLWSVTYGFGIGISGLMYVALLIGYLLGILFFTLLIDKTYPKMIAKNNGVAKPEYRLPFLIFSGFICPVGLFWYGWSADKQIHWIMPEIGAAIFAFGVIAVFQTIQNYLIDMNPRFSASSIAAAAFFRSMLGFAFPLFITQMINKLGFGWTYTFFGFLALAFGIPFPLFVIMRGEKLRLWANKRLEKEQAERDAKNYARLQRRLAERDRRSEKYALDQSSSSTK